MGVLGYLRVFGGVGDLRKRWVKLWVKEGGILHESKRLNEPRVIKTRRG